ncbi:MAG: hypothetical protein EOM21_21365 [Gammaproteobacteria bacterium]|nr:hypothetical protein [Gammaproteobacteria bacterium]
MLNEHLIASIYPVDRKGIPVLSEGMEVLRVPITEATMEVSLAWQSPFEAMGPEATSPTLLAMVQSGMLSDLVGAIPGLPPWADDLIGDIVSQGIGRTGLTKMNSTQVFTGMPPLKINATLLFRAWGNAAREVENPFDILMGWALPQCLQKDSILTGLLRGVKPCGADIQAAFGLANLLPSLTPQMVGMVYKGRSYKPLVIESVGFPMDSPITSKGRYTELLVPITMATWQAYDRADWESLRGDPFAL